MILPGGKYYVFLATRPVDFRKGHAGLSLVIQTVLGRDPYSGALASPVSRAWKGYWQRRAA